MPSKKYALGAILLLAAAGLAQTKPHIVKQGETLSHLSAKYGVSVKQILNTNGLKNADSLKLGMKLQIPTKSTSSQKSVAPSASGYQVRKGDNDNTIAKRLGISVEALHRANPGVKWNRLQIGQGLNAGAKKATAVASARPTSKSGAYQVKEGDNDWIIARRFGTTAKQLSALNPKVNWERLQIGQTIRVPGGNAVAAKPSVAKLSSRYAIATDDSVNLRRNASTEAAKVGAVNKGDKLTVLDRDGDWYRVKTASGDKGWVRGDFLKNAPKTAVVAVKTPAAPKPTAKSSRVARGGTTFAKPVATTSLLDHAFAMRGTRYVWGGTSRSGVDCSGFTTNVYRSQGVSLPRTSRDQSRIGMPVSKSELRPGDLVFFKTGHRSYINHVGIYAGDGKFIHASSAQRVVRIDNLASGYYSRQFVTARRVASKLKPSATKVAAATESKPKVEEHDAEVAETKAAPAAPKPTSRPGADAIIR